MALATSYTIADMVKNGAAIASIAGRQDLLATFAGQAAMFARKAQRVDISGMHGVHKAIDSRNVVRLPYELMWLESGAPLGRAMRTAVLARQIDSQTIQLECIEHLPDRKHPLQAATSAVITTTNEGHFATWTLDELTNRQMSRGVQEQYFTELFSDAVLAVSLMNCKNVNLADGAKPFQKYAKKKRRIEQSRLQFKTIVLPGQESMPGQGDGVGLSVAWHLVRGHFATYSEDKPRFGIPGQHGTFWIGPHARGQKKHGIVQKDYEVA